MNVEIRLEDKIDEEERARLFNWGEDIFGVGGLEIEWRPKDRHIFLEEDGRVVTHVGVLRHELNVAGRPVAVGGIGGVVTHPDAQGRGYARRALRYAETFMCRELGVEFGFLFCRDALVPFYARLGWRLLDDPVEVEQSSGPMVAPFNAMALPCGPETWPRGAVTLNSLPW